jgi:hypothetical protein
MQESVAHVDSRLAREADASSIRVGVMADMYKVAQK